MQHTYLRKAALEAVPLWEHQDSLPAMVFGAGRYYFSMHFALCHSVIGRIVEHPTEPTNLLTRKNIFEGAQPFQHVTLMAVGDGTSDHCLVHDPGCNSGGNLNSCTRREVACAATT